MKAEMINSRRQDQAEHTREVILRAASLEFRRHGFDGASTAAITEAANVNQSLLYYHFKSKMGLYKSVVLDAIQEIAIRAEEGLSSSGSVGERLLRSVVMHFDRFITHPEAMSLMQQEMLLRSDRTQEILAALEAGVLRPAIEKFGRMIEEGIKTGELREVDWKRALGAILGANANYFLTAPIFKIAFEADPLSHQSVEEQRSGIVMFWATALFVDPEKGALAAARVLRELPFPGSSSGEVN